MKQTMCFGLAACLLAFVGMAAMGTFDTADPDFRIVPSSEAKLITGGGQYGDSTCVMNGVTCNGGDNGCTGKGPSFGGDPVLQGFVATGYVYCGGANCSSSYIVGGHTNAPE